MRFQIIYEASHPGRASLRVGPHSDVFINSLENWPTQLELGINFVKSRRPLQVKRSVLFRHGVLAIGFLAHFDVSDGIAALFDVSDLRGRILGRAVEHSDGDHCRPAISKSA